MADLKKLLDTFPSDHRLAIELTTDAAQPICRVSIRKIGAVLDVSKRVVANPNEKPAALVARAIEAGLAAFNEDWK
jgi:hypothetical protein